MTFEQHSQHDPKTSIRPIRPTPAFKYCDRILSGTQNHIKQAH
jgi:hypothetical protein